jgi:hypothetical protein
MSPRKSRNDFDPTRQQLEDLQALLDRMLQIPVLQPSDVPDNVLPARRVKPPSLLVPSGSQHLDPKPVLAATPAQLPVAPSAPPTLLKPSAETMVAATASAPGPAPTVAARSEPLGSIVVAAVPSTPTQLPPVVQSDSEPVQWAPIPLATTSSRAASRPSRFDVGPPNSLALAPLRAINWCFDWAVSPLGAPGRWLRSRTGRIVLGWIGVLLVLLAAGWGTTEATLQWIAP